VSGAREPNSIEGTSKHNPKKKMKWRRRAFVTGLVQGRTDSTHDPPEKSARFGVV
jgi:hypothetical protein